MKSLLISLIMGLTAATCAAKGQAPSGLYGQRLVMQTSTADAKGSTKSRGEVALREVAGDLANWLRQATGKPFETGDIASHVPESAILLLRANCKHVVAADRDRLKDKGKEAFLIRSEGNAKLWIVGNSELAVQHGVYLYLDQLGCRWFLPNDHWKIIPSLKSITLKIDRVEAPAWRCRDFIGTGGFGGTLAIDPKKSLEVRWGQWKAFNSLGGEIRLSGHAGGAFNAAHKKELEAHPEYLAEIGGKRQSLSGRLGLITKPCISNADLRKLYIDWTLARFKRALEADPDGPSSWGVSVEPADGGGQCQCEQCQKIGNGSDSDKVFFMANEAAKAVAANFPGRKVMEEMGT